MNKISKKIVALVTMAAFVLTLVPFAAFGATTDFSVTQSTVKITKVNDEDVVTPVTVKAISDKITLNFEANNKEGSPFSGTESGGKDAVKIWAVDADGNVTDALEIDPGLTGNITGDFTAKVSFARAGVYTIYAGMGTDIEEASKVENRFQLDEAANTVTVYADPAEEVSYVNFAASTTAGGAIAEDNSGDGNVKANESATLSYTNFDKVPANGIATDTITVTARDSKNELVRNAVFDISVIGGNGMSVDKTQATTDRNGQFKLTIGFTKAADYKIVLTNGSYKSTLNVKRAEAVSVQDIEVSVDNGKTLLAGNDVNFTADNGYISSGKVVAGYFADAVQFTITDKNGDVVNGNLTTEPASDVYATGTQNHDSYVKVTKPQGSTLAASDIDLAWNEAKGVYTLVYTGSDSEAKTDLIPGEYTVSVALLSGESATATFTLAKFGTVEGLNVKVYDNTSKDGSPVKNPVLGNALENEIVLGKSAAVVAYKVDENGLEVPTKDNVSIAVEGSAVNNIKKGADLTDNSNTNSVVAFGTGPVTDEEKLVGTQVKINAFDTVNNKWASAELTVVDGKTTNTLAFDNESGEANKNNTVNITVVDENGKVVNAGGTVYAYVESQADENAYVDVNVSDDTVTAGKGGKITVFADRETTADIVVAVVDSNAIYAKTLTYTFGEEDIAADTSVVMTIGSNDFVVNNDVVNVPDAAPYIANSRTYVPFRALGEALGAEVEWDNDARTVTYTLGKTEVVMTIGETTYTVNGEEKTMDVAPEITNDRTYVPVRFVGEALGFKVTALSAADGTTSSVVFQK